MGSALSVRIAEIVMQKIENEINILSEKIFFWRRYADDVFLITKNSDVNVILSFANHISTEIWKLIILFLF